MVELLGIFPSDLGKCPFCFLALRLFEIFPGVPGNFSIPSCRLNSQPKKAVSSGVSPGQLNEEPCVSFIVQAFVQILACRLQTFAFVSNKKLLQRARGEVNGDR
ncbi:hypothetical protein [Malonomonas rubra]|uniref:hypothetical protein n=1 Tax=Malonomonas rubra TaxID=57040 RepID=UPI00137A7FDE|nr:hypothetical protein [Malonomonas rubra]